MKKLYTIGEVSGLLNINAQTLRYYDKIGVVRPAYVDEVTGYRKYTYDQINYIDRVRYLQDFGLSLDKIRMALENDSVEELTIFLQEHRNDIEKEINSLKDIQNNIDWYINYYSYIEDNNFIKVPFKCKEENRWILTEPFTPGEGMYATAGYRLTKKKNSSKLSDLKFLRQHGYLLDYTKFVEGEIMPTHYFVYLKEEPKDKIDGVIKLPEGQYFCVRSRILNEGFNNEFIPNYFSLGVKPFPLIIANEYEDNFSDFKNCIYEIQIHI